MSDSSRQLFRGVHRPLRLTQLRLGQDWEMEVRPLSLSPQPAKPIHIKIKYRASKKPYGAYHSTGSGDLPSPIS